LKSVWGSLIQKLFEVAHISLDSAIVLGIAGRAVEGQNVAALQHLVDRQAVEGRAKIPFQEYGRALLLARPVQIAGDFVALFGRRDQGCVGGPDRRKVPSFLAVYPLGCHAATMSRALRRGDSGLANQAAIGEQ
jgi:hypothetical protein